MCTDILFVHVKAKELQKALGGEAFNLEISEVESLLKEFDIIPKELRDAEAASLAREYMTSIDAAEQMRLRRKKLLSIIKPTVSAVPSLAASNVSIELELVSM